MREYRKPWPKEIVLKGKNRWKTEKRERNKAEKEEKHKKKKKNKEVRRGTKN